MNSVKLGCPHSPKVAKKIGMINGDSCEVLVCKSCQNDSDFQNFQEIEIQEVTQ